MKSKLQVFFYSIFSGILLSVAIPNELYLTGYPFVAFIAIIPYFLSIKNSLSYKMAFWCGFIQTLTTHLLSSFWLAFFKDFAIFTLGASALGTALIGSVFSILMYIPYEIQKSNQLYKQSKLHSLFYNKNFCVFYFTSVYVLYEYIKSSGFLGYPWGTVSSSMYNFSYLTQIASITGTYGITFLVVLFNCILEESVEFLLKSKFTLNNIVSFYKKSELKYAINTFSILFILSLIYGAIQYNLPRIPHKSITTILVQQNDDPWDNPTDEEIILLSENLTQEQTEYLRSQNKEPQLVVWSEGNLQRSFPKAYSYYTNFPSTKPLIPFIQEIGSPFILGGITTKKVPIKEDKFRTKYYNSTLIFNKNGKYIGSYQKLHLVPFAELIPGFDNPFVYNLIRKIIGISAGWSKGENLTYFDFPCTLLTQEESFIRNYKVSDQEDNQPYVRVATPICYDDAFTDTIRPLFNNGAELFVNVSDDSWSRKRSSEYQHFVVASYRSIEYRTTFVRSTNAGYSVILDPTGKILASLPLFTKASLSYDIPIYKKQRTTYADYGNWLCHICFTFAFLVLILKIKNCQE